MPALRDRVLEDQGGPCRERSAPPSPPIAETPRHIASDLLWNVARLGRAVVLVGLIV